MKIKFSQKFHAVNKRIAQLPKMYPTHIKAFLLKDVQGILVEWHSGIANRTLGLQSLADSTVAAKRRKGQYKPKTPLYGEGDKEMKSYINMWQIRKKKNGWSVRIKDSMHHSGLPLRALFRIHEFGATIQTKNATIRIPSRPAGTKAYQKWLNKRKKEDPAIKKSITEFINTGKSRKLAAVNKLNEKEKNKAWYG